MSDPTIQPPLEEFGDRPFSFYPPILNIEHNEWRFVKSSWSEMLVHNTATNVEVWIPRLFIGELSRIDEPVMIVGLNKELEYSSGSVWPAQRRVLGMPRAARHKTVVPENETRADPTAVKHGVHFDGGAEARVGKLILGALLIGIVLCVAVIFFFQARSGGRVEFSAVMQTDLNLTEKDDYFDVVRKMGKPTADRWRAETGEMQYRVLEYPEKGVYVILMGVDRDKTRYVGSMDHAWKVVHSVLLPGGGATRAMLLKLPKF